MTRLGEKVFFKRDEARKITGGEVFLHTALKEEVARCAWNSDTF